MKRLLINIAVLGLISTGASAEWINNVKVAKLGTYQHAGTHFIWFKNGKRGSCDGTVHFQDQIGGGKGLLAVLLSSLNNQNKLDIQLNGCAIVEVYAYPL